VPENTPEKPPAVSKAEDLTGNFVIQVDGPGLPLGLAGDSVSYTFDRFRFQHRIAGLDSEPAAPVLVDAPLDPDRAGQYLLTGDSVAFP
jgi:hypothetical protein